MSTPNNSTHPTILCKFSIYGLIQCLRMLGRILIVYVTLCLKPLTNAKYAACGSIAAILLRTSICLFHRITFL